MTSIIPRKPSMANIAKLQENRLQTLKECFATYLKEQGCRKTSERMAMLEAVYYMESRFNADELYFRIRKNGYRISLTTIYNNIELFVKAGLLKKQSFRIGMAQYKKSFSPLLICNSVN